MGIAATSVHAAEGVQIRCGVVVESLGTDGVRLVGGELVPADVIVVGVGVSPATEWLEGSGLELRDGIVCDATLAAGPPGVYAAGDVARGRTSCTARRCASSTAPTPPSRAPSPLATS